MDQPPDDVEIEPDEQTDAFTVSVLIQTVNSLWESDLFSQSENSRLLKSCYTTYCKHDFGVA